MDRVDREILEVALELDINPLVVFDREGELVYYNREAEILLSYIEKRELFQFAVERSPTPPETLSLQFQRLRLKELHFRGYWVSLLKNRYLLLRLFIGTEPAPRQLEGLELVDLTLFLEWFIEYSRLKNPNLLFTTQLDPTIPPFYFQKRELFQLLRQLVEGEREVQIGTKILVGEYLKIGGEKFGAVEIRVTGVREKGVESRLNWEEVEGGYRIKLPLIKEQNEVNIFR
jgi:hypothetical protein